MAPSTESEFKALYLERARLLAADEEYKAHMAQQVAKLKQQVENMRAEQSKRAFVWDNDTGGFIENTEYISPAPGSNAAKEIRQHHAKAEPVKSEAMLKSEQSDEEDERPSAKDVRPTVLHKTNANVEPRRIANAKPTSSGPDTTSKALDEATNATNGLHKVPASSSQRDDQNDSPVAYRPTAAQIAMAVTLLKAGDTMTLAKKNPKQAAPNAFPDIMTPKPLSNSSSASNMNKSIHSQKTDAANNAVKSTKEHQSAPKSSNKRKAGDDLTDKSKKVSKDSKDPRNTMLDSKEKQAKHLADRPQTSNIVNPEATESDTDVAEQDHVADVTIQKGLNGPVKASENSSVQNQGLSSPFVKGRLMADITPEQASGASAADLLSLIDLRIPATHESEDDQYVAPATVLPPPACSRLAMNIRELLSPSLSETRHNLSTMRRNACSSPICLRNRKFNRAGHRMAAMEACRHCSKPSRGSFCIQIKQITSRPYVAPLPAAQRVGLNATDPLFWVKMDGLSA